MKQTPWGLWEPFSVEEVRAVLAPLPERWWIAGGLALEQFAGRRLRDHDDIDIGIFREAQGPLRELLDEWDVHAADPPGTLRAWALDETLPTHVHDVWVRRRPDDAWRFQFMLDDTASGEWVFRRDARIRRPISELTWRLDDVDYLMPEIQLLYKSRGRRPKDESDLAAVLPRLEPRQRQWLRQALLVSDPDNPWLEMV